MPFPQHRTLAVETTEWMSSYPLGGTFANLRKIRRGERLSYRRRAGGPTGTGRGGIAASKGHRFTPELIRRAEAILCNARGIPKS